MNHHAQSTAPDVTFLRDVVDGLTQPQKTLPCKYLYDQRGSQLFDQICELDEYYPTRTELKIMEAHADSIAYQIGKRVMLVEYGSGSSIKTRTLLDALDEPVAYVPVDISEEHLLQTADSLQSAYPEIEILPVTADFTRPFALPVSNDEPSHVALYFPGSTIGNFTPSDAGELLQFMSTMLGTRGGLLIGIDLQKDVSVIEAAYNDAEGVTADFNLNLLTRVNSELDGDFDLERFEHKAIYNADEHRMEISILSLCDQQVWIGNRKIEFGQSEEILSEYSHKYTIDRFARFAAQFGFSLHKYWTDDRNYFGVLHLVLD
jgi:dimethylhistidine N-methyltransferase